MSKEREGASIDVNSAARGAGRVAAARAEGRPQVNVKHLYPSSGGTTAVFYSLQASCSSEVLYSAVKDGCMQTNSRLLGGDMQPSTVDATAGPQQYHQAMATHHLQQQQQGSMQPSRSDTCNNNNMMMMMSMSNINTSTPCAACKLLRRRCAQECPFAPYFSPHEPQRFASVHKVYGASNVSKMLLEVPEMRRGDAANSLVYEANARLRDPVYGCMGLVSTLQQQAQALQAELNAVKGEVMRYSAAAASSTCNTTSQALMQQHHQQQQHSHSPLHDHPSDQYPLAMSAHVPSSTLPDTKDRLLSNWS